MKKDKIASSISVGETYYERIKDSKNPVKVRLRILQHLFECKNISEVSRTFKISRKTLKKWEARYYKNGIEGLKDKSKAPKSCSRKISKDVENLIIDIKTEHPDLGVRRIRRVLETNYNIYLSIHPIYRVLKSANLI